MDHHLYPWLKSIGKKTVLLEQKTVGNKVDSINQKLSQDGITENKVKSLYENTVFWQNQNWAQRNQQNELWENVRNNTWITDLLKEKAGKPLPFLNSLNYSKLIQENKKKLLYQRSIQLPIQ